MEGKTNEKSDSELDLEVETILINAEVVSNLDRLREVDRDSETSEELFAFLKGSYGNAGSESSSDETVENTIRSNVPRRKRSRDADSDTDDSFEVALRRSAFGRVNKRRTSKEISDAEIKTEDGSLTSEERIDSNDYDDQSIIKGSQHDDEYSENDSFEMVLRRELFERANRSKGFGRAPEELDSASDETEVIEEMRGGAPQVEALQAFQRKSTASQESFQGTFAKPSDLINVDEEISTFDRNQTTPSTFCPHREDDRATSADSETLNSPDIFKEIQNVSNSVESQQSELEFRKSPIISYGRRGNKSKKKTNKPNSLDTEGERSKSEFGNSITFGTKPLIVDESETNETEETESDVDNTHVISTTVAEIHEEPSSGKAVIFETKSPVLIPTLHKTSRKYFRVLPESTGNISLVDKDKVEEVNRTDLHAHSVENIREIMEGKTNEKSDSELDLEVETILINAEVVSNLDRLREVDRDSETSEELFAFLKGSYGNTGNESSSDETVENTIRSNVPRRKRSRDADSDTDDSFEVSLRRSAFGRVNKRRTSKEISDAEIKTEDGSLTSEERIDSNDYDDQSIIKGSQHDDEYSENDSFEMVLRRELFERANRSKGFGRAPEELDSASDENEVIEEMRGAPQVEALQAFQRKSTASQESLQGTFAKPSVAEILEDSSVDLAGHSIATLQRSQDEGSLQDLVAQGRPVLSGFTAQSHTGYRLSPVTEESVSDNLLDGPYSPVPDLIIEPEPNLIIEPEPNWHDDPPELCQELEMRIRRLYNRVFVEDRECSAETEGEIMEGKTNEKSDSELDLAMETFLKNAEVVSNLDRLCEVDRDSETGEELFAFLKESYGNTENESSSDETVENTIRSNVPRRKRSRDADSDTDDSFEVALRRSAFGRVNKRRTSKEISDAEIKTEDGSLTSEERIDSNDYDDQSIVKGSQHDDEYSENDSFEMVLRRELFERANRSKGFGRAPEGLDSASDETEVIEEMRGAPQVEALQAFQRKSTASQESLQGTFAKPSVAEILGDSSVDLAGHSIATLQLSQDEGSLQDLVAQDSPVLSGFTAQTHTAVRFQEDSITNKEHVASLESLQVQNSSQEESMEQKCPVEKRASLSSNKPIKSFPTEVKQSSIGSEEAKPSVSDNNVISTSIWSVSPIPSSSRGAKPSVPDNNVISTSIWSVSPIPSSSRGDFLNATSINEASNENLARKRRKCSSSVPKKRKKYQK